MYLEKYLYPGFYRLKTKTRCKGSGKKPLKVLTENELELHREGDNRITGTFGRGICRYCLQNEALVSSGKLRRHYIDHTDDDGAVFVMEISRTVIGKIVDASLKTGKSPEVWAARELDKAAKRVATEYNKKQ